MKYTFECELCGVQAELDIPMSEYDTGKDRQVCAKCSGKMKRVLEWQGGVKLGKGCYGLDSSSANNWTVK